MKTKIDLIAAAIKETLEGSSVHAVPNLVRAKHLALRVIWTVCLLLSVSGCAWYLSVSISTYFERKIVTNIQINRPFSLSFPIVSICDDNRKGFSFKDLKMNSHFLFKTLEEHDFESYSDSRHGNCLRFNSGISSNGTSIPFKSVNDRGSSNGLGLFIDSKIEPRIWLSNEKIDSLQDSGSLVQPGFVYEIKLHKFTLIKQPIPYSLCVDDLIKYVRLPIYYLVSMTLLLDLPITWSTVDRVIK